MPDDTPQQQAATLTAASMPAAELDEVHDALRKTEGSVRRLLDAILIAQRHSPSNKPVILSGGVTQPVLALKHFASLECAMPSLL